MNDSESVVTTRSGSNPGIGVADRRLAAIEDQPQAGELGVAVVELDDDAARRGAFDRHPAVHPPGERDRVDLLRHRLGEQPAHGPLAERHDHRLEVLARRRQVVLVAPTVVGRDHLDDALAGEVAEPLGEQRAGDARQTPLDLVEAGAPEHHLAQDQGRPPLGQHLAAERDRAVLPVLPH